MAEYMSRADAASFFQEIRDLFADTDIKFKDTDQKFKDTDQKFKDTEQRFNQTERFIKELGKQIGGLGDKFGYFTEGMAFPALENLLLTQFGMETINPRVRVRRAGREQEYDVLAWSNGQQNTVVVVEVKSRVKMEAVGQLVEQLENLFEMMPDLAGKDRIGILAGIDWDMDVEKEAQAAGLYTARIRDDIFELTTRRDFQPRRW